MSTLNDLFIIRLSALLIEVQFLYLTKVLSGLQQPHQSYPIWKHLVRTGRLINTLIRVLSGGCFSWCFSEFHSLLLNLISMRGWFMQLTLVFPFNLPYPDGPWFVFIRYSRFFFFSQSFRIKLYLKLRWFFKVRVPWLQFFSSKS